MSSKSAWRRRASLRWPDAWQQWPQGRVAPAFAVALLFVLVLGLGNMATHKSLLEGISWPKGIVTRATHVKSWDGQPYGIVVDGVCDGREAMRVLPAFNRPSRRRMSPTSEAEYQAASLRANAIGGWMLPQQIQYVKTLTRLQHAQGIVGSVGEIGVFHGKFFISVAGFALEAEPMYAMDLFDELKNLNIDGSGVAVSESRFLTNLQHYGIPPKEVKLLRGDSNLLSVRNFTDRGIPLFRMLSVDGSHTLEATLHDLTLASCITRDGGIVVVDDISNIVFFGVVQAVVHFSTQGVLFPFLLAHNKIYMTTESHHKMYLDFVVKSREFLCEPMHLSRRSIGEIGLCIIK